VPLGPVLPDWPAGWWSGWVLQGDVVQHAEAGAMGLVDGAGSFWTEPWRRAAAGEPVTTGSGGPPEGRGASGPPGPFPGRRCWDDAATTACALRDDALGGRPVSSRSCRTAACRAGGPVRVLAWSIRGAGDAAAR